MARKPETNTAKPTASIPKCRFAGDPGDEYCKACNGVTMKVEDNGPDIPCTSCGGYEAGTAEEPVDQSNFQSIPDGINEEVPFKEEEKKPEPAKVDGSVTPNNAAMRAVNDKPAMSNVKQTDDTTYQSVATTTEIKAESGLSCELQDKNGVKRWYKFMYSETRSLPAGSDVEAEKQKLWDDVNGTVDDQLRDTVNFLNS